MLESTPGESGMTRVAILPVPSESGRVSYKALASDKESTGRTAGEALDSITAQLPSDESGTLVIVQNFRPDRFFSAEQQQRLGTLMQKWREARDLGAELPPAEQAELDGLIEAELTASTDRAKALLHELAK